MLHISSYYSYKLITNNSYYTISYMILILHELSIHKLSPGPQGIYKYTFNRVSKYLNNRGLLTTLTSYANIFKRI